MLSNAPGAHARGQLVTPKNDNANRTIPLVDPLPELLAARYLRMKAERHPGLRRNLVFPTLSGELHKGTPLNKILKQACREAGVTIRFTPHGLRRTWNNVARRLANGRVVRAIIGHGSEAMTDHYSMVDKSEKRATAEAVSRRLRNTERPREGRLVDETVDTDAETSAPDEENPE